MMMQITNVVCPKSKYSIKCPDVTEKDGIAVHNTANDASAMSEISYMLGNNNKVSFHAAVDNYRVVTGLPLTEVVMLQVMVDMVKGMLIKLILKFVIVNLEEKDLMKLKI